MSNTEQQIAALNNILSSLKVKAHCAAVQRCRNIDLYDIILDNGGRLRDVERNTAEIGLALRAKATPMVRPMMDQGIVRLQAVVADPEMIDFCQEIDKLAKPRLADMALPIYLGETIDSKPMWLDFHTAPHILIAGTSGSGKSTLLHAIIGNAIQYQDIDIYLIDTKNIEFSKYAEMNRANVLIDNTYDAALETFQNLYLAMEGTYQMMRDNGFPSNYFATPECTEPFRLVVIDEFADLVMQDRNGALSDLICKIAQKGRAAGIHIVLATQRPSVDVISGTIKANFPTRIVCRVASKVDSQVVLDGPQACSLVGRGDALLKSNSHDLLRFQVAYSTAERNISMMDN